MAPKVRLSSKVHSCSELEKGHKKLLTVKKEGNDPDEFDAKIKDPTHASFISCDSIGYSAILLLCGYYYSVITTLHQEYEAQVKALKEQKKRSALAEAGIGRSYVQIGFQFKGLGFNQVQTAP